MISASKSKFYLVGATKREWWACGPASGHAEMWTGQSEAHIVEYITIRIPSHDFPSFWKSSPSSCQCNRLQLRCNQQDAELRRRELHSNRLKERLSQLTDRHKEKGHCETPSVLCLLLTYWQHSIVNILYFFFFYPAIEVLNFPPGVRGKREQPIKSFRPSAK